MLLLTPSTGHQVWKGTFPLHRLLIHMASYRGSQLSDFKGV